MKYLRSKEKKELLKEFEELFGISSSSVKGSLFEWGKQKIRLFSGSMSREELAEISRELKVEVVGLYVFKKEKNFLRLSMDGCQVFSDEIKNKKRIFELNDKQLEDWMRRKDLDVKLDRGVWVVRHGEDFISCGYSNTEKLLNFVPKERSVRKS